MIEPRSTPRLRPWACPSPIPRLRRTAETNVDLRLNVDGSLFGFTNTNYTIDNSKITAGNSDGATEVAYDGVNTVNLYTQAGAQGADQPTNVTVRSLSAAPLSIYTGSGDFVVTVKDHSSGVNIASRNNRSSCPRE